MIGKRGEMWFTWMDFWGWDIQSLSVLGRAVVLPRLAAPAFSGPSGKKGVDYLDIWHLEKKVMITWTSEFWITWITWTVISQFWREKKTPRTLSGVTEGWTNITEIRCLLCLLYPNDPIIDFKVPGQQYGLGIMDLAYLLNEKNLVWYVEPFLCKNVSGCVCAPGPHFISDCTFYLGPVP